MIWLQLLAKKKLTGSRKSRSFGEHLADRICIDGGDD